MLDFKNFDDENVYNQSQDHALNHATKNFVVEFGKEQAHIAFNIDVNDVQTMLSTAHEPEKPVRWMYVSQFPFTLTIC